MTKDYTKISIKDCPTFFYLSDGKNIVYLQKDKHYDRYTISSVHKPSHKVGTGYQLTDMAILDAKTIDGLLPVNKPSWANKADIPHIIKYQTLESFINHEKIFFGDRLIIEKITL